jgi:uncharacterized membrane protein
MMHFGSFLIAVLGTIAAAQVVAQGRTTDVAQAGSEQRRVELRQMLKTAPQKAAPPSTTQEPEQAARTAQATRRLSPTERADLRQQLRQQRAEPASDKL